MQVQMQMQVLVPYLNGLGVRVDGLDVAGVLLLGPINLQQLENRPDSPLHAIAQDQLLPSQHILQQGYSQVDRLSQSIGSCVRFNWIRLTGES